MFYALWWIPLRQITGRAKPVKTNSIGHPIPADVDSRPPRVYTGDDFEVTGSIPWLTCLYISCTDAEDCTDLAEFISKEQLAQHQALCCKVKDSLQRWPPGQLYASLHAVYLNAKSGGKHFV